MLQHINTNDMSRHGSSNRRVSASKWGARIRGRTGQVISAHHARLRVSRSQIQVKKRMWKSAIARVKRLRDEGRKFEPLVKIEERLWKSVDVSVDTACCIDEVTSENSEGQDPVLQVVNETEAQVAASEAASQQPGENNNSRKPVKRVSSSVSAIQKKSAIEVTKKLKRARNKK